jgi:hypothetical protein
MAAPLLEILQSIPDRRRAEGKRVELATVLLYSIQVAGANSYGQMHEFIHIHRQRMNEAFGLAFAQRAVLHWLARHTSRRRRGCAGGGVSGARFVVRGSVRRRDGHRRRR